ncbi:hypothetical protein MKW92_041637 [Papaver armeniacum]|nr:hypothetical protein MKW92_041637 [Papaver armeniacum]
MEEGRTKIRRVRCPKCNKILTEPPNSPVYQCGGCGTILQAKIKPAADGLSQRSNEEIGSVKSGSDRGEIDVVVGIKDDNSISCPKVGDEETVGENMANGYDSKYKRRSKSPMNESLVQRGLNMDQDEVLSVSTQKEFVDVEPQIGIANVYQGSDQIPHRPNPRLDGMMANQRMQQFDNGRGRFPSASYVDEGSSSYQQSGYSYGYGKPIPSHELDVGYGEQMSNRGSNYQYGGRIPVGGSNYPYDEHISYPVSSSGVAERVQFLENDRAELLKQLQEIQIKLGTSGDVTSKPIDRKVPPNARMAAHHSYGARDPRLSVEPSGLVASPSHPHFPGKHVRSSSVNNVMNRHLADLQTFYPPPNELPGYPDMIGSTYGRNLSNSPQRYPHRPSHDYFHGGFDPETGSSYPNDTFFHQPACSCVHCYNKHLQVPLQVHSAVLRDRRFTNPTSNPMGYNVESRPRSYYNGGANPHLFRPRAQVSVDLDSEFGSVGNRGVEREVEPRAQVSVDLDSEIGSVGNRGVERQLEPKSVKRRCYPALGGAPFITCHNCFGLLKLPRKFLLMQMNERMLKCGTCSTIIRILVESKKLICIQETPLKANDEPVVVARESNLQSHGHAKMDSTNSYSDDYGNYRSMDSDSILSSTDPSLKPSQSEKIQNLPSSFTATTDGEVSPHNVIAQGGMLDLSKHVIQPPPGSSLQELFEYSTYMRKVDKPGSGNNSIMMEHQAEMVPDLPTTPTSLPNSTENVTQATVIDTSFNDTYTSQDSDAARADMPTRSSIYSSDSDYTVENETPNVSINGHPLSDHLVRKAQKQAGRIYPGDYWYDFRAGFWGAMGQPCSGVIPPHIQEFNYPMPKDCSGGDTSIIVNGRELREKDLNLLASRGLPVTKNKSYNIEISGSVVDNDSGEELDSLGKLAPTIEKLKRGFGMKVPKPAAA